MGWMCVKERGHIRRTCQRRARQKKKITIRELEGERFSSRVQCRICKKYSGGTNREEERQRQRKKKDQELTSSSPSPSSVTISKVPSSYTSVASSFELTKYLWESDNNAMGSVPKAPLERGELSFRLGECRFWLAQGELRTDDVRCDCARARGDGLSSRREWFFNAW